MKILLDIVVICLVISLYGCGTFSHTNVKLDQPITQSKASFIVLEDRGTNQRTLVILSLSGGGSRAAYFSGSIMLALENVFDQDGLNILEEVDIISAVSGGSLPAAFYAISKDSEDESASVESNRTWDKATVNDLMSTNYRGKWVANWFWPSNIAKYWFTAFDKSDMMAQTFADNLFDMKFFGFDLKFKDINPTRPYIVLNSTNGTTGEFSSVFTFTQKEFEEKINSDIDEYEIARAVMATASFPAVFNYMTLKNYHFSDNYIHVFDGGNSDNLGLKSVEKILDQNIYEKVVVILVDSFTKSKGVSPSDYDGRQFFDYAVDLNFIDSSDSLLSINREQIIDDLSEKLEEPGGPDEYVFYHIQFNDIKNIKLKEQLNAIKTDFKISDEATNAIDKAVDKIIVKDNICLIKIKEVLQEDSTIHNDWLCTWPAF